MVRLITAERTLAEQRERWLVQQDEMLTWRLRAEAAEVQLQQGKETVGAILTYRWFAPNASLMK